MKKFIRNIALFTVIVLVSSVAVNALYQAVRYRDKAMYTEDKFQIVPDEIEICNFGSSHGLYGFDYTDFQDQYTTFNFSLTFQSLSYDYRILQQYEDKLADGGVMFIPISYFSFAMNEEAEDTFESKNDRYYSFLEPEYIKQYSFDQDIKNKFFALYFETPSVVVKNLAQASKKGQDFYGTKDGDSFDFGADAKNVRDRLELFDDNGLIVRNEEYDALIGIIDIAKKHNIRPVLITTPYRDEYNQQFDEEFYSQFYAIIKQVCSDKNVEYYDYSHDERFTYSNEYNRNADHLSEAGARKFTKIVMEEIVGGTIYE